MMLSRVAVVIILLAGAFSGCLGRGGPDGTEPSSSSEPPGFGPGRNRTLSVDFSYSPKEPVVGQQVMFQDRSNDSEFPIADYAWDFGDGRGSTAKSPVHRFLKIGDYPVTLRVKNEAGYDAVASHLIRVKSVPPGGTPTTIPPTPTNGDKPPPPPEDYLVFGDPLTVQNSEGGEPSLAIGRDGKIFVNPIGTLYRSTDEGKSFHQLSYISLLAGDSHVVTDRDDRVWVSDLGGATVPFYGSITVWVSEDGGDSFEKGNPAASDTVVNDRNWLAATRDGKGFLLYRQCGYVVTGCIGWSQITRSLNGGVDWTPIARTFAWTSFPFADPESGALYVVGAEGTTLTVAASQDDGVTFAERTVATRSTAPETIFVHGDVDDAGNLYVVWVDKDTNQFDVWLAVSADKGATWSRPHLVSSGVGTNVFPWVATGAAGNAVVAWYGTPEVGDPDSLKSETPWYVMVAHSSNALDANPSFAQSRATDYVVHQGPICTQGSGCGGNDRDLLDFLSVDLTPSGTVGIAFGEDGAGQTTKTRFVAQTGGPLSR